MTTRNIKGTKKTAMRSSLSASSCRRPVSWAPGSAFGRKRALGSRRVTFSSKTDIRIGAAHHDAKLHSKLWYSRSDLAQIRSEIKQALHYHKAGKLEEDLEAKGLSLRGLESLFPSVKNCVRRRRFQSALIVLLEDDRQVREHNGVINAQWMADRLRNVSRADAASASLRGLADESAAISVYVEELMSMGGRDVSSIIPVRDRPSQKPCQSVSLTSVVRKLNRGARELSMSPTYKVQIPHLTE